MKPITKDSRGITISVTAEPEHIPVRGNVTASDEPELDKQLEDEIIDRLDRGDTWAWCSVRVEVTYRGVLSADTYLGCCSYDSEKAFRDDGYFDDMVSECIDSLNSKLAVLTAE